MSVSGPWRVGLLTAAVLAALFLALATVPGRATELLNAGSTVVVAVATVGLAAVGYRSHQDLESERKTRAAAADAQVGAIAYPLYYQLMFWIPSPLDTDPRRRTFVELVQSELEEANVRAERMVEQAAMASPGVAKAAREAGRLFWLAAAQVRLVHVAHKAESETFFEIKGAKIVYAEDTRGWIDEAWGRFKEAHNLLEEVVPRDLI